jgi:hypothetical protein
MADDQGVRALVDETVSGLTNFSIETTPSISSSAGFVDALSTASLATSDMNTTLDFIKTPTTDLLAGLEDQNVWATDLPAKHLDTESKTTGPGSPESYVQPRVLAEAQSIQPISPPFELTNTNTNIDIQTNNGTIPLAGAIDASSKRELELETSPYSSASQVVDGMKQLQVNEVASSTVSSEPKAVIVPQEAVVDQGVAVITTHAPTNAEDDFDDFGDFSTTESAPPAVVSTTNIAANADDDDDEFGDFGGSATDLAPPTIDSSGDTTGETSATYAASAPIAPAIESDPILEAKISHILVSLPYVHQGEKISFDTCYRIRQMRLRTMTHLQKSGL